MPADAAFLRSTRALKSFTSGVKHFSTSTFGHMREQPTGVMLKVRNSCLSVHATRESSSSYPWPKSILKSGCTKKGNNSFGICTRLSGTSYSQSDSRKQALLSTYQECDLGVDEVDRLHHAWDQSVHQPLGSITLTRGLRLALMILESAKRPLGDGRRSTTAHS